MEEWRSVPGYEGIYEVSSLGRVKSLARVVKSGMYGNQPKKERILKQQVVKGHCRVYLMKDGKGWRVFVHRLMAMAFLGCSGEFDRQTLVCHKNDIGTDNRLENLYLGTYRTNYMDRDKNGNGVDNRGERHGMCKLKDKDINEIKILIGKGVKQKEIAKMYGIDQSYVSRLKNNLNRTAIN